MLWSLLGGRSQKKLPSRLPLHTLPSSWGFEVNATEGEKMGRIASKLTREALSALCKGDILAIRVPDFMSKGECCRLGKAVTQSPFFRFDGTGFCGIGPGGFALPTASDDYFGSGHVIDKILAAPRTNLEQALGHLDRPLYGLDKPMRALTARRYTPEFIAPPHQDHDLDKYPWALTQLGISLGLVSPKKGGAIRLWDLAYPPAGYAKRVLPGRKELNETLIPSHDEAIESEVGELLIVNARRIHAIDRIQEGERISVSGFLAVEAHRIYIWS
jgi:hypothetical protein